MLVKFIKIHLVQYTDLHQMEKLTNYPKENNSVWTFVKMCQIIIGYIYTWGIFSHWCSLIKSWLDHEKPLIRI